MAQGKIGERGAHRVFAAPLGAWHLRACRHGGAFHRAVAAIQAGGVFQPSSADCFTLGLGAVFHGVGCDEACGCGAGSVGGFSKVSWSAAASGSAGILPAHTNRSSPQDAGARRGTSRGSGTAVAAVTRDRVKGSVIIVGNFLSGAGGSRGVCEELAERLATQDWQVLTASAKRPRLLRIADMLLTVLKHHREY